MAAELGLLSLNQLQKLAQQQPTMWTYSSSARRPAASSSDDDDSWEVRAFAEDTGSAMGTTWPPRSYTCTFCRREFRSAQALGGHMNVHRRDRARLRQSPPEASPSTVAAATSSPPVIFPPPEFVAGGGGLCLFYQIPNGPAGGSVFAPAFEASPSTLLSISPYPTAAVDFPTAAGASLLGRVGMNVRENSSVKDEISSAVGSEDGMAVEELDLELRLGW